VAMVFVVKRRARLGKAGTDVVSVTQRWHEDADTGAQTQSVSCRRMQFLEREWMLTRGWCSRWAAVL
jgi:hypothetical protein